MTPHTTKVRRLGVDFIDGRGADLYAISLNWGRIAQKGHADRRADQSAALLASRRPVTANRKKVQYLQNTNQFTEQTGILIAIFILIIAIIVCIVSWGSASPGMISLMGAEMAETVTDTILVSTVAMAVANLALQVCVIQPMITSLWNNLQKNQPMVQQFFEPGISTALAGSVTDMGQVTDYFDLNANGVLGTTPGGMPQDSIGRFAFYYTERLKMLNNNLPSFPQVSSFFQGLGNFLKWRRQAIKFSIK